MHACVCVCGGGGGGALCVCMCGGGGGNRQTDREHKNKNMFNCSQFHMDAVSWGGREKVTDWLFLITFPSIG